MKQQVGSRNNNSTNNRKSDTDTVRPEVSVYDTTSYMVKLGIGTFPNAGGSSPSYLEYNFYFDTGSDLLWLQCDSTRTGASAEPKYFKQDAKIFNREGYSSTYNPLPHDSPNDICRKYADDKRVPAEGNGFCGYRVKYADGATTEGVLATEKLTISADDGGIEEINDIVIGCGYRQNEPDFGIGDLEGQNPIAGMLGLGGGEESFIRQLGDRVDNKFEYCLIPFYETDNHDSHTFLRFGSDTKIVVGGQGVQTTHTVPVRGETLYYVNMLGISIDKELVVYPEGSNVFNTKQDGTGGVIFDSGSEATTLSEEVFVPFMVHLVKYFSQEKISSVVPKGKMSIYDLCFKMRNGFNEFPDITFHFDDGADFVMDPVALFSGDEAKETFCLIIRRSKLTSSFSVTLGSMQQGDRRILYDVGARKISWVKETCKI